MSNILWTLFCFTPSNNFIEIKKNFNVKEEAIENLENESKQWIINQIGQNNYVETLGLQYNNCKYCRYVRDRQDETTINIIERLPGSVYGFYKIRTMIWKIQDSPYVESNVSFTVPFTVTDDVPFTSELKEKLQDLNLEENIKKRTESVEKLETEREKKKKSFN